jgi:DNA ligase 1
LLFDSGPAENKYIVRFIDKNLKIGCAEKSMQAGLTKAIYEFSHFKDENKFMSESMRGDYDHYETFVKRALCEYPDY